MKALKRTVAFLLVLSMVLISGCGREEEVVNPNVAAWENAQDLLAAKDYKAAAEVFESLGGYEEAPLLTIYSRAMQALKEGKYESAYLSFEKLDGYLDSRFAASYAKALYEKENGKAEPEKYLSAAEIFDGIPLYKDSEALAGEARKSLYNTAESCLKAGDFENAYNYFEMLADYSDSTQMTFYVVACYHEAKGAQDTKSYLMAVEKFEDLNGFRDSAARAEKVLENTYAYALKADRKSVV